MMPIVFWCLIGRHADLLQWTASRIFLKCQTCGRKTPGWELQPAPPVPFKWSTSSRQTGRLAWRRSSGKAAA
jgi:hypothetical protein